VKRGWKIAAATGLAMSLAACSSITQIPGISSGSPDHIWRTDGYSMIITVTGNQLKMYETTAISCIPDKAIDQVSTPAGDGTVSYGNQGVATVSIHQDANGHATIHGWGSAEAGINLLPISALPANCSKPVPDTPINNFDVFWQTFAENYNSFGRKNINWQAVRDQYRPMVTNDTSKKELFSIFKQMIAPLGDAHTEIDNNNGDDFTPKRPGTRDENDVSGDKASKAVDRYLKDTLNVSQIENYANDSISYADLPDGRGYLRIKSFSGYGGKPDTFLTNSPVLTNALNTIFTAQRVAALKDLIIDVRFNDGGDDALGLQVAGRLTNTPYVAFRKQARNDPNDPTKHTPLQTVMVNPTPGVPHYTGPIQLLASDLTISAGETFDMDLLGRQPAPVRYGTPTQGVFSDQMFPDGQGRTLPNGWNFELGNEDYFDANGHNYEGVGVPPNVPTPVFTDDELKHHEDSALTAATQAAP
jgi:hypothetical protein